MRLSLCTISFRHHLVSLEEIARWAAKKHFDGIELWAVHARNMQHQTDRDAAWLGQFGLSVPMLSDYLPLADELPALRYATADVCRLARRWGARKVRTFVGSRGSAETSPEERRQLMMALRFACGVAADQGCELIAETHPGTLADNLASTMRLIEEVDHPALGINFDTLHVWESGADPLEAHERLLPHIRHYHLKNVASRDDLAVFAPANVYAAAGTRAGMTPLFEGAVDYLRFLTQITATDGFDASLEWFGGNCWDVLAQDAQNVRAILRDQAAPIRASIA